MSSVVALNAHPDDETLLGGGTLARLAAEGHRVVIVVATDGMMNGDEESDPRLRLDELTDAAAELGVHEVRWLGYADSGHGGELYPDPVGRVRLARAGIDEPAGRLAAILREVSADLLVGSDEAGGYRHRDHMAVHHIARRAAALTGVRLVEATAPRESVLRVLSGAARIRVMSREDLDQARTWFTPAAEITHRIDVRRYVAAKQRALAAHRSEVAKDGTIPRVLRAVCRVPAWIIAPMVGTEYYVEPAGPTSPSDRLL